MKILLVEFEYISIHAPRTGSDVLNTSIQLLHCHFNPRSPHGERLYNFDPSIFDGVISIHAPRTGSDVCLALNHMILIYISIHAPRTGSDSKIFTFRIAPTLFQSTLPARGATTDASIHFLLLLFQSTLPARGATTDNLRGIETSTISIHAPRTGSDGAGLPNQPGHDISIHAPRTGSDGRRVQRLPFRQNFNPRSPHGERRRTATHKRRHERFQSTLPARGATHTRRDDDRPRRISIHAPRTGSD